MKLRTLLMAAASAGVIAVPGALAAGEPKISFSESRLRLEGDSTLHPYTSKTRDLRIVATLDPSRASGEDLDDWIAAGRLSELEVTIPVKSLKSGEGLLDSNMYKALAADKYPNIRFRLTRYKAKASASGAMTVHAQGKLAVAGKERNIELEATGTVSDGRLRLKGTQEILMSDFGVEPPILFLGALKVKDRISVHYDLIGEAPDSLSER